jgi:PTS system N-acetylglucosamine-specific IIC component
MKGRFSGLQQLGRALMLPIAVLPIAGLLLRLGQPDVLDWPTMAAAGDAIFSNLGLLFAVGVAVGLARCARLLRSDDERR